MEISFRNRLILNFKLILLILVFTNCKSNNEIVWKDKKQLIFSDFKGHKRLLKNGAQGYKNVAGLTSTKEIFYFESDPITKVPKYRLRIAFIKNKSSLNSKDSLVLRHERIHFNIHELYCRKVRCSFDSLISLNMKKTSVYFKCKNKIKKSIFKLNRLFDKEQVKNSQTVYAYDSIISYWEKRVSDELDRLNKYSDLIDSSIVSDKLPQSSK